MKQSIIAWIAGAATMASIAGMGVVDGMTKDITLVVDGQRSSVRVSAATVGQVLADQRINVGIHDQVAPAADTLVSDGLRIVVAYGHEVDITVDGVSQTLWTTGATVDGVLAGLGITNPDAQVSPPRDTPITVEGAKITVETPKVVQVRADGATSTLDTTAATVGDLLAARGLTLSANDRVSPASGAPVTDGLDVTVQRVQITEETTDVVVPFTTTQKKDGTLDKGKTKVKTTGVNGLTTQTWQITTVDGVEESRTMVSEVVKVAVVNQVELIGTRVQPPTVAAPAVPAGSAQDMARSILPEFGFGDDQFGCLVSLWARESGWRVNAQNRSSGAYGIPQALPGSKMARFGDDWQTNPATQIRWGLSYIQGRYGSPCGAWEFFGSHNWY